MAETRSVPELRLVLVCFLRGEIYAGLSLFCIYTTQLPFNVTCTLFFKILSSPYFCGLRPRIQISQPQARECCCQCCLISGQLWACLFFLPLLFSCSWCCLRSLSCTVLVTDQGGHTLVLTAHLLTQPALVAPMQELPGFTYPWFTPVSASCLLSFLVLPPALNCSWLFPKLLEEKMDRRGDWEKRRLSYREGGHNLKSYTERWACLWTWWFSYSDIF